MKAYKGVDIFWTSAQVEGEWLASRPGRFTPTPEPVSVTCRREIAPLPGLELPLTTPTSLTFTDCYIYRTFILPEDATRIFYFKFGTTSEFELLLFEQFMTLSYESPCAL